ncbi:hypothetical protein Vlu01_54230 [Micromonospora lutea]|uniref:Uncharacterized protein n=1 Tax=Micromonospora lutea TaxID=419825 RepID=A0ABQ4J3T7_9ACTN|nr:hypothetical protein Vlu01_54230 [Micromonospora lutea]
MPVARTAAGQAGYVINYEVGRAEAQLGPRPPDGCRSAGNPPVFAGAVQRFRFAARLRGGVNRSAIAAMADGTSR